MNNLQTIDQLLQQLNQLRPLSADELAYIQTKERVEHVWSSTALEGNTINEEETAWVILDGLTIANHPLREHFEVKATDLAYSQMLELARQEAPITLDIIKELNKTVTTFTVADVQKWGNYRKVLVYPFGGDKNTYAPWEQIPEQMDALIEWLHDDNSHPVEKAARLHLNFVTLHPFVDGNGRTARLLMNLILIQHGFPVINIQPDENSRLAYILALKKAQLEKDEQDFLQLIADYVEKALRQRIEWIGGASV